MGNNDDDLEVLYNYLISGQLVTFEDYWKEIENLCFKDVNLLIIFFVNFI